MLRAGIRIAALLLLFLACLLPHLLSKWLLGRSAWPRRFLGSAAWIAGARVHIVGEPIRPHTLLLSNHVSWLDIFVLGSATGCAFVSKAEIADSRLVKWFADQNHTLYVRRSEKRAVGDQASALAYALEQRPQPLALFPEGTVGTGGRLLPFRPALLSAVAPPPAGAIVRPVALDYGAVFPELSWAPGEHGLGNGLRLLGRAGHIPVRVELLEPLEPTGDRKALARRAHDAIAAALAPSGIVPASSSVPAGL